MQRKGDWKWKGKGQRGNIMNSEHYRDPTAETAERHIREEERKKELNQWCRILNELKSLALKSGIKIIAEIKDARKR